LQSDLQFANDFPDESISLSMIFGQIVQKSYWHIFCHHRWLVQFITRSEVAGYSGFHAS